MKHGGGRPQKRRVAKIVIGREGSCACCSDSVPVRLCAIDQEVANEPWVAPDDLLHMIVADLSLPETLASLRAICAACEFQIFDRCHFWLQADPSEAGLGLLAGPYCDRCLKKKVKVLEGEDGRFVPPKIYMVKFDARIAKRFAALDRNAIRVIDPDLPNTPSADPVENTWAGYKII